MSKEKRYICLISPGHISSNPRLVKEANALSRAGYQVKVIAADFIPALRPFDKMVLAQSGWAYQPAVIGNKFEYMMYRLRQKWAKGIIQSKIPLTLWLASLSHHVISRKLVTTALSESADLYIAHYIAALPAAALAARKYKAKFGFDAEDYHVGEMTDTPENRYEIATLDFIERTLLPHCTHLTTSSPLIAKAYNKRYGVMMEPILNVFPLSEMPDIKSSMYSKQPDSPFTFYWFSQTIGSGRGLEMILHVLARLRIPIQLILRGSTTNAPGFMEKLFLLAQELGIAQQIQILPTASPEKMAQLASIYDIGMSIEQNQPCNRAICLTNKIFTYLLAGIPVLLSHTPAQEALAKELGDAAILVDLNNTEEAAIKIEEFLLNPERLQSARYKARQLAQEQYNWDIEQQRFLSLIKRVLD